MTPRFRTAGWVTFAVTLFGAVAFVPGCRLARERRVPFTPPLVKPLAPADSPCARNPAAPPTVVMASAPEGCGSFDAAASDGCPMRRPRNILVLSGGGAYGAYSAGFMDGWTRAGTRPEFDVVTGISTGSLIAPFAFLGPDYDAKLSQLYTKVQAEDVFRIRTWVTIPFRDSIATSLPLQNLIESQITPDLMESIADEHRKGRRLYVGTTNLDTSRLVVWDLGAIACRPCPEGCRLFRDVLLASCSVPGIFPPVRVDLTVDGQPATELHVDGGVTAQMFVPSHVFAAAAAGAADDASRKPTMLPAGGAGPPPDGGNVYVVVAGKLYPDAAPVKANVLPVLGASTRAIMYAYCRADLANVYGMARAAGLRFHVTALPQSYPPLSTAVQFEQDKMVKLFGEGVTQGKLGPAWMGGPPALSPGDGDYIRTGTRLRTVEEHEPAP
jgi:predicted patatin/cPLA2 family phospholipase